MCLRSMFSSTNADQFALKTFEMSLGWGRRGIFKQKSNKNLISFEEKISYNRVEILDSKLIILE